MKTGNTLGTCPRLAIALALVILGVALLSPITALSTRAQSEVVPFDVTISLYGSPDSSIRPAYEKIIQYFADAVYEMSNTANKVRRVEIYSGGDYADRSNIKWMPECHPCANVSGYGRDGMQVIMCDKFGEDQNYLASEEMALLGGYGSLGHEWGHYFYGLFDEYQDPETACAIDEPGMPCDGDTPANKSLMNNGDLAAVTGDLDWLNFSTSLNDTKDTAQYRVMGASGWDTLVRSPNEDPASAEESSPPRLYHSELAAVAPQPGQSPKIDLPDPSARSELQIVWMGGSGVEASARALPAKRSPGLAAAPTTITTTGVVRQIVIENSSSMAADKKLATVKETVLQELETSDIGDTVGIITFDATVKVVQPLTVVDSQATKDLIKNKVRSISAGGADAAVGDAAKKALEGFETAKAPEDSIWAVYLITDGPSTTGISPTSMITDYQEYYTSLYTFGYGVDDEAADTLQDMAESTEGEYYFVNNRAGLVEAFDGAYEATLMSMAVSVKEGYATVDETTPLTVPIFVDSTLGELTVDVYYEGEINPTLKLLDPKGASGGEVECSAYEEEEEDFAGTSCYFEVSDPISGTWQFQAETTDDEVDLYYAVGGSMKDDIITYYAEADTMDGKSVVNPSQPVLLYALVEKDYPIMKAVVTGTVDLPNGNVLPVNWRDDGQKPDDIADDGIYAASLKVEDVGDYYVTVAFNNSAGTAMYSFESYAPKKGKEPMPKPYLVGENFERTATVQFYVPLVVGKRPPPKPTAQN